jgi:plasmid maintenance system antidote protein VapI
MPNTKLDWDTVNTIRQQYATTDATAADLATEHNVGRSAISAIIRGDSWQNPWYTPPTRPQKPPRPRTQPLTPPTRSRLDWDTVHRIREHYALRTQRITYKALAETYGISANSISGILRNVTWHDPLYTPHRP